MDQIKTFRERRLRLLSQMQKGVAIIATSPLRLRNRDAFYPYRFDSYFYYLTGFYEPEAVLVVICENSQGNAEQILFCREKNEEREIWDGFRYGPDAADIIKLAMIAVHEWLIKEKMHSMLIMQVHDELVLEVPYEEVDRVKQVLPDLMENVCKLNVPLQVELGVGNNWEQAH